MLLLVMFLQELLGGKHFLAVLALYDVGLRWYLDEALVAGDSFTLHLVVLLQVTKDRIKLLDLFPLVLGLLVKVLVLQVQ